MRLADVIIIAAFLILATVLFFIFHPVNSNATVVIKIDGREEYRCELSDNDEFTHEADGKINVIKIENGGVSMVEANCPDKLCVRQGVVRPGGVPITCLPNRVTVEIIVENADTDAISR